MRLAQIHLWKRFEHYLVCKIVLQFLFVEHIDCLLLEQGILYQFDFFYTIRKMTYFLFNVTSLWHWFNITVYNDYQCHNDCGMIVTLMWNDCDTCVTPVWHNCDTALVWHNDTGVIWLWHWFEIIVTLIWDHSNTDLTSLWHWCGMIVAH